ncbi:MAG: YdcF family protein [Bacteroidota bacterium]|nr:YdcF family protein [Bacteroidota bacterium]
MIADREKFIILVDNDYLKESDAIILLEGDGLFRVEKAVELYNKKFSRKIVFSGGIFEPSYGSFPADYIVPELLNKGVNKNDIIIEGNSFHTQGQSVEIINLCIKENWKRIILVASHYHQYRAYLTFLKAMYDANIMIEIINATSQNLHWFEETGWGKRFDLLESEFIKIEKYSKKGHLATFGQAIEYQKWKEQQ